MGRVCDGPRVLWTEFVMGRDVPEPSARFSDIQMWLSQPSSLKELIKFIAVLGKPNP